MGGGGGGGAWNKVDYQYFETKSKHTKLENIIKLKRMLVLIRIIKHVQNAERNDQTRGMEFDLFLFHFQDQEFVNMFEENVNTSIAVDYNNVKNKYAHDLHLA